MRKETLNRNGITKAAAGLMLLVTAVGTRASELNSVAAEGPGYLNMFSMLLMLVGLAGFFLRRGSGHGYVDVGSDGDRSGSDSSPGFSGRNDGTDWLVDDSSGGCGGD